MQCYGENWVDRKLEDSKDMFKLAAWSWSYDSLQLIGEYPTYMYSEKYGHAQSKVSSTNVTASQVIILVVVATHMEVFVYYCFFHRVNPNQLIFSFMPAVFIEKTWTIILSYIILEHVRLASSTPVVSLFLSLSLSFSLSLSLPLSLSPSLSLLLSLSLTIL